MTRTVYIVRHGNTFDPGDTVTRVGARTDLPLSTSGNAQAEALAAHFAGRHISFAEAYSSPLKRTMQTAEAILAVQPMVMDLEFLEFLREVDYGPDENMPEAKVEARIGKAALTAWDERAVVPSGWQIDPGAVTQAWKSFFGALAEDKQGGPVLVVTSNGIARFALQLALDGKTSPHALKLKTGAYGRIQVTTLSEYSVLDWNQRPE